MDTLYLPLHIWNKIKQLAKDKKGFKRAIERFDGIAKYKNRIFMVNDKPVKVEDYVLIDSNPEGILELYSAFNYYHDLQKLASEFHNNLVCVSFEGQAHCLQAIVYKKDVWDLTSEEMHMHIFEAVS
ncbi:hypothetical protein [Priestia megaterium]|uniref:Uncharacterized protein n=1 Tax=Priestia megaterium TaxID=1404 RepID=A0A6M6E5J9_PRIMG|nr:hypothetical protein [Priestia megaterium]QJX80794.1 hypothetical protein FDZ14_32405 [Priestia megaterium]